MWDAFYRESVRGRVEALLTARAAAYLASLEADLEAATSGAASCEAEQNLGAYVWCETAGSDLGSLMKNQQPQQLAQQQQAGGDGLAMKCK